MPNSRRSFISKFIGNKAFYLSVLAIIVPVIIQNSISNFVSLLDNLMVGSVGEAEMNGVSISNNLFFVFYLCIFGGMSGATIFAAQFYGAGDENGVRHCFRFSLYIAAFVSLASILIIGIMRNSLLNLWINPETFEDSALQAAENLKAELTFKSGIDYIDICLWGLVPFAVTNAYAGILRITGETKLPMVASIAGVITNCFLNWVLIFGHFGLPSLGVKGAAIATVISRYVETGIIIVVSHKRVKTSPNYAFLRNAYSSLKVPVKLFKNIVIKGMPLLLNECLWSTGMTMLSRQYSLLGLTVVNATTITSTITNLFNVFFVSMGTAASVLVGRCLGANDAEGAKDNARKIILFEELICIGTCLALLACSKYLPLIYTKSSADAKSLASNLIRVSALVLPLSGFAHCTYFILRSGGKTIITFLFDCVYTWVVPVPLAWYFVRNTGLGIVAIYAIVNFAEIFKDILGYILLKKGIWIQNIVSD